MVAREFSRIAAAAVCIYLTVMGGCATSKPAKFYLLQSMETPAAEGTTHSAKQDTAIVVGPIGIPEYLDRPEIVTRSGKSGLQVPPFERWGEPLEKGINRVLARNISFLLSTGRVALYTWPTSIQFNYQVTVDIHELDASPDGNVLLDATWTILGKDGQKSLTTRNSSFKVPVDSSGYDGIVLAESRAVEHLSREIAQALNSYLRGMPPS